MQKKEKFYFIVIIIVVILIISLPQIYGLVLSNENYWHTGINFKGSYDTLSYFSFIEQAKSGEWLLKNLYTNEPQIGMISPLWWLTGIFARLAKLSAALTLYLVRVILSIIYLIVIYFLLIKKVINNYHWRLFTLVVLAFSSGFGIFNNQIPDSWFPDSNTFLLLNHLPNLIFPQIALVLFFVWLIKRLSYASLLEVILVSIGILILGLIHTFDLVIIYSVGGVWIIYHLLAKKYSFKELLKFLLIITVSSTAIFYFLWLRENDATFFSWSACQMWSPSPLKYILGFGLLFLFFILGSKPAYYSNNKYLKFLLIWAVVAWFLIYIPVSMQRRFINGLHIPTVLIGMWWLANWYEKHNFKKSIINYLIIIFTLPLFFITTVFNIYINLEPLYKYKGTIPLFISKNSVDSFQWLKRNLNEDDVVLANNHRGEIIPAYSGKRVFVGHPCLSANAEERVTDTEKWFFAFNKQDKQKYLWLLRNYITYIYYGPAEKVWGKFKPGEKSYLELVYSNKEVEIYRVLKLNQSSLRE